MTYEGDIVSIIEISYYFHWISTTSFWIKNKAKFFFTINGHPHNVVNNKGEKI